MDNISSEKQESKLITWVKTGANFVKNTYLFGTAEIGHFIWTELKVEKITFILHILIFIFLILSFGWILFAVLTSFILGSYIQMVFQIIWVYFYKKYIVDKYFYFIKEQQNKV